MLLLALAGCEAVEPLLWEVREPPVEVRFSGAVLASAFDFETPLTGGSMTWSDPGGQLLALGEEPDPEGSPGYWSVTLPAGAPYVLEVDGGAGSYPALYSGAAPEGDGLWFTGAIFGWPAALTDPYLEDTAAELGLELLPLSGGGICHLWGSVHPDVAETLDPGRLRLIDGSGAEVAVAGWRIEADGSWRRAEGPPVDYLMAYNLSPGAITLRYDGEEGPVETTWAEAPGGAIITPWYYLAY